ncbi:MAG: putative pyridoxine 5'-phosphate oxidase superfamily flavin-nucleotide-binding protein [Ascidiaceihabitans sp.]|jgi:predicted pyridoxine 5'-phosphate oxidase superfamily flavin-nucleotide-binding protein
MKTYADVMFTPAVRAQQDRDGTGESYARRYANMDLAQLGPDEADFLGSRTSIYMASVSQTGWPYVQHRGGPAGFLKVLNGQTLGFADYRGNRQYISKGNLSHDNRVSLFAMDYARKARLKLQGYATFQDASDAPELAAQLATEGEGRVERVVTITVETFDWNCPKFITPRFDAGEIAQLVAPEMSRLEARIAELEAENAALKGA